MPAHRRRGGGGASGGRGGRSRGGRRPGRVQRSGSVEGSGRSAGLIRRSGSPSRPGRYRRGRTRTATTCATIDTAVSAGVRAPRSSPTGPYSRASCASSRPAASSRSRRAAWVRREPSAPMKPRPRRSPSTSAASKAGAWSSSTSTSASVNACDRGGGGGRLALPRGCPSRAARPGRPAPSPIAPLPTTSTERHRHPEVQQQLGPARGRSARSWSPRAAAAARADSVAAASRSGEPRPPCASASSGAGQHQRGGAVHGGDQGRRLGALQGRAQRVGDRGRQRMPEQRGPAGAGQPGGDRGVLGDVRVAGLRGTGRGRGERPGGGVQGAAEQLAGHRAGGGAGQQLPALHGAEPVPLQHPDHADPAAAGSAAPASPRRAVPSSRSEVGAGRHDRPG